MAGKTIQTFCETNEISRSFYYKLKQAGLGPREMRLGTSVRITPEAERDWQEAREAETAAQQAAQAAA